MKRKQLIREAFREAVFSRDGYKCKFCERTDNLDAHHIVDRNLISNGGYVKENGVTLCPVHHMQAEEYHISGGHNWVEGLHPDQLYVIIGSSRALADEKSAKLK